jgi:CBS domain-containing protein
MQVKDLLATKGRDVATISQGRPLADALRALRERGIGALVVTGASAPLVGIFSERDAVRAIAVHGGEVLAMSVADFMSSDVATCTESTTIDSLMAMMTERRIRHVPVVDDAILVGLVSIGDVVKHRIAEIETEHRAMRDYIATA